jgi:hypothetical protein
LEKKKYRVSALWFGRLLRDGNGLHWYQSGNAANFAPVVGVQLPGCELLALVTIGNVANFAPVGWFPVAGVWLFFLFLSQYNLFQWSGCGSVGCFLMGTACTGIRSGTLPILRLWFGFQWSGCEVFGL